MKLQTKLFLTFGLMLFATFALVELYGYQQTRQQILMGVRQEAKVVQSILMATRRVYHLQFINSGVPLSNNTLGFLPAHALSLISEDFKNWNESGMTFNNVSDRSRNQRNQADEIELEAMVYFRSNPEKTEHMTFQKNANGEQFYHFSSPIWVEQYCLKCHGSSDIAPRTIRDSYNTAYDYKLGELRGLMSIKLPSSQVIQSIINIRHNEAIVKLCVFGLVFIFGAWLLRKLVVRKLSVLQAAATLIGTGDYSARIPVHGKDEIRDIAVAFNHMAEELIQAETARQSLESGLRQKNKMEAIGIMAGGLAHNFNNNLSIILGNVELAQMKLPKNSEVVPLLEDAKIGVYRSRKLVKKITSYSQQGKQNKILCQLTPIIEETVSSLKATLPSNVNLQQQINPESHSSVINADPAQIKEVLLNLCNNAVRAMNENGELKISLNPVELSQKEIPAQYYALPGNYAKISVQDTGCGIPAQMLDKIFDPFYTTKETYEGAGMGLATVQGVVALHGGLIKVNSILEKGTVFDLYLPLADKVATEPKPTNEDAPTSST